MLPAGSLEAEKLRFQATDVQYKKQTTEVPGYCSRFSAGIRNGPFPEVGQTRYWSPICSVKARNDSV